MTKMAKIEYRLSEAGRKASLLAGGSGEEKQTLEAPVTPELLELANVTKDGRVRLSVATGGHYSRDSIQAVKVRAISTEPGWEWHKEYKAQYFDTPQTAEALIAWERERRERVESAKNDPENLVEIERLEKEYAEKAKREAEEEAKREAERAEREAAAKAEREQLEQEKDDWITAHGSDHLKRAHKLGYDCQRQYITERAAMELPEFTVDFDNYAEWKSRACPSKDALDLVEELIEQGHNAKCVWLTRPWYQLAEGDYYEDPEEFDPCEAVVVEDYLGKYTLILVI